MIGCEQTTFENPVKWKVLFSIIDHSVSNSFFIKRSEPFNRIKKEKVLAIKISFSVFENCGSNQQLHEKK
jgi:hypothetical protein